MSSDFAKRHSPITRKLLKRAGIGLLLTATIYSSGLMATAVWGVRDVRMQLEKDEDIFDGDEVHAVAPFIVDVSQWRAFGQGLDYMTGSLEHQKRRYIWFFGKLKRIC